MEFLAPHTNWIAVLGSAAPTRDEEVIAGFRIGRAVARHGKNLICGATSGIPYAAALGAKHHGALAIGISPAADVREQVVDYHKPIDGLDLIVYTGLGWAGRNPLIVQSAPAAIFVAGEAGTLNEFTAAWMNGNNVLGVLEGVGGVANRLRDLVSSFSTGYGSEVLFDSDPGD